MAENSTMLFIALILGIEYGFKEIFENCLVSPKVNPIITYVVYRIINFAAVVMVMPLVFTTNQPWYIWLFCSIILNLIGLSELLFSYLNIKFFNWLKIKSYLWCFLSFLALIFVALIFKKQTVIGFNPLFIDFLHAFISNFSLGFITDNDVIKFISVVIFLSQSANYLIRWLICKEGDVLLIEAVFKRNMALIDSSTLTAVELAATQEEQKSAVAQTTLKAGRIIGILERWLLLIIILKGQYGSTGFVLAAKSVARYKDFEKPYFAEYYLMGTLYSTIFTFILAQIIKT